MAKTRIDASLTGNVGWKMNVDGHQFITDAAVEIGGNNNGPRPKAILLGSLIGCTGIDVKMILDKMKVEPEDIIITAEAESATEHPKVYTKIHLTYRFKGKKLPFEKLEKAIKLSQERYCPITAMLNKAVPITYDIVTEE